MYVSPRKGVGDRRSKRRDARQVGRSRFRAQAVPRGHRGTPPQVRARGCARCRSSNFSDGGRRGGSAPKREVEGMPLPPSTRSSPGYDPCLRSEMEMRGFYPPTGDEVVRKKSGTAEPFLVLFCSSFQWNLIHKLDMLRLRRLIHPLKQTHQWLQAPKRDKRLNIPRIQRKQIHSGARNAIKTTAKKMSWEQDVTKIIKLLRGWGTDRYSDTYR